MKIAILGSRGQLGHELAHAPWPTGCELLALARREQDVTDEPGFRALLDREKPSAVLNASAYTAVDAAETDATAAFRVNRDGPASMARACAERGVMLVHVSTDFVFDGRKPTPYVEDDAPAPLGIYGQSKLEGERAVRAALSEHLIVRTSWVYGAHGNNFVRAILRLARERELLRVVDDQVGRPTSARALALALVQATTQCLHAQASGSSTRWGTYHFADRGAVSRYEQARYIVGLLEQATGRRVQVEPVPTSSYPTPAQRPLHAVLDTTKLERTFGVVPLAWQDGVAEVVEKLLSGS